MNEERKFLVLRGAAALVGFFGMVWCLVEIVRYGMRVQP